MAKDVTSRKVLVTPLINSQTSNKSNVSRQFSTSTTILLMHIAGNIKGGVGQYTHIIDTESNPDKS